MTSTAGPRPLGPARGKCNARSGGDSSGSPCRRSRVAQLAWRVSAPQLPRAQRPACTLPSSRKTGGLGERYALLPLVISRRDPCRRRRGGRPPLSPGAARTARSRAARPPRGASHSSDLTLVGGEPAQVSLDTTMFGNFEVMSFADSAILTASLRAIAR